MDMERVNNREKDKENYNNSKGHKINSGDILTVPNMITFLRIILIIPFVLCFFAGKYIAAAVMLVLSGLSDCTDGFIARKYNQISDFGKVLDPVADKLTLLAVGVCICFYVPYVSPVMMILIIKDVLMLAGASVLFKKGKMPPPAKWYGKIGTVCFYVSIITIVFLKAVCHYENSVLSTVMLSVTAVVMIFALVKYFIIFLNLLKGEENNDKNKKKD